MPVVEEIIQPREKVYVPDIDLTTLSLDELANSDIVYNRELTWLDFNWRVLAEALDARTAPAGTAQIYRHYRPAIWTNSSANASAGSNARKPPGWPTSPCPACTPDVQLQSISKAVRPMMETQSAALLDDILPALAEHGIRLLDYDELDFDQQQRLRSYYLREVYPILTPLAVDPGHPFPFLSNLSLSLGVFLRDPVSDEAQFARVKIPQNRPRWVPLDDPLHFVPLEQVIIHNLDALFSGMDILAAYPFRVTRNADIARNEEEADDLLDMINEELREQRFAAVVRLEVDEAMPASMLAILQHELELEQNDIYPDPRPAATGRPVPAGGHQSAAPQI